MPEISRFYGIRITMNPNDHSPPHFHAEHGDDEASIDIRTGQMLAGNATSLFSASRRCERVEP